MSIRDKILESDDLDKRVVDVPEWGVKVEVRTPNGRDRARITRLLQDETVEPEVALAALLIPALFDPETGDRIFTEDDADVLVGKNGNALQRLAEIASGVSGLTVEAVEEGKGD